MSKCHCGHKVARCVVCGYGISGGIETKDPQEIRRNANESAEMTALCWCGRSLDGSVSDFWCSRACQRTWNTRQARRAYWTVDAACLPHQGYTGGLAAATVLVVGRAC